VTCATVFPATSFAGRPIQIRRRGVCAASVGNSKSTSCGGTIGNALQAGCILGNSGATAGVEAIGDEAPALPSILGKGTRQTRSDARQTDGNAAQSLNLVNLLRVLAAPRVYISLCLSLSLFDKFVLSCTWCFVSLLLFSVARERRKKAQESLNHSLLSDQRPCCPPTPKQRKEEQLLVGTLAWLVSKRTDVQLGNGNTIAVWHPFVARRVPRRSHCPSATTSRMFTLWKCGRTAAARKTTCSNTERICTNAAFICLQRYEQQSSSIRRLSHPQSIVSLLAPAAAASWHSFSRTFLAAPPPAAAASGAVAMRRQFPASVEDSAFDDEREFQDEEDEIRDAQLEEDMIEAEEEDAPQTTKKGKPGAAKAGKGATSAAARKKPARSVPQDIAFPEDMDIGFQNSIQLPRPGPRPVKGPSLFETQEQADISGVTIVDTVESAKRVLAILTSPAVRKRFHAVDTEVMDIDVRTDSPVGHGRVTCLSIYVGPDVDFGSGPKLWIDTLDLAPTQEQLTQEKAKKQGGSGLDEDGNPVDAQKEQSTLGQGEGGAILEVFRSYLEDPTILKVWHNYSFDRHVLGNHGISVRGFGGDTMQMARLENAARDKYALEHLSSELLEKRKRSMKELFSMRKMKKDGTLGLATELPPVEQIQRDRTLFRNHWIDYSTYDTQATWEIREVLERRLRRIEWLPPAPPGKQQKQTEEDSAVPDLPQVPESVLPQYVVESAAAQLSLPTPSPPPAPGRSMWDFYLRYWLPFGEMLCDMETNGIWVDAKEFLPKVEIRAEEDKARYIKQFTDWAIEVQRLGPNQDGQGANQGHFMNIHSAVQKQHFFFAGRGVPRKFAAENTDGWIDPTNTKKNAKPKKNREFVLEGLGIPITQTTEKKMPAVAMPVMRKLCGKIPTDDEIASGVKPKWGTAFDHFGGGAAGEEACRAIDALCKVSATNIMLTTFIRPLQTQVDQHGRIHCSLNLNTETGRLSSRKPNLQNQPALEKDVYRIREAFAATPGKKLIVADYGQLELRILAHIANCKSMIEAFKLGGDFHSRTAMGMYPHVAAAIANKEVLLEWDEKKEGGKKPPLPVLKDAFAVERRKAKVLNFSIAYGKTAMGLSQDWNVSLEEAKATLEAWYRDRPEVKKWQLDTIRDAHSFGCTRTLMGRYRPLPGIHSRSRAEKNHNERAAINTPIQGGAADVVMKAMLLLHQHKRFRELGWKILLQIHDEVKRREKRGKDELCLPPCFSYDCF
jgi:DNA polymerase-1